MFYSVIDAASLRNPTILNYFRQRKVSVQYEPESPSDKYHYIFLLEFEDSDIENVITTIQLEMLKSWYSFFWSETVLYIVFNSNYFKIDPDNDWSSEDYKAAQNFGRTQDIPEVYLDFKTHFQPYKTIVDKLNKMT